MAGIIKNRERTELLAGVITLGVAVLLLVLAAIFMTRCNAEAPTDGENTGTASTESTSPAPTAPTLPDNPYGPGDFAYNNGYLTCIGGKSTLGIDVSSHQGLIEWDKVATTDVEFAMIRVGYRGYSNGLICEDTMWLDNMTGARENGLKIGAYFFSQAISIEEALEEATFLLELLQGMELDMPVVFDWEPIGDSARTAHMDAKTLNACAIAFCEAMRAAGYEPMVYFNIDLSSRLLSLTEMQEQGYHFWLAMYSNQMTYPYQIDMWQYSDGGSVAGIQGDVDLNLYFTYE